MSTCVLRCGAGVYVPAQQYEEECEERRQLAARVEELEVGGGWCSIVLPSPGALPVARDERCAFLCQTLHVRALCALLGHDLQSTRVLACT